MAFIKTAFIMKLLRWIIIVFLIFMSVVYGPFVSMAFFKIEIITMGFLRWRF